MLSQDGEVAKRFFVATAHAAVQNETAVRRRIAMRRSIYVASFTALTLALGGCASSLTGDTYSRDEARAVQTVRYGTIESLRPVKIEGTKTPIGAGAGVAAGAMRRCGDAAATRDAAGAARVGSS